MQTLNVGLIGVGNIAPAYIRGCAPFDIIKIVACADILDERAQAFAAEHDIAAYGVDEMLAREDIDIVLNLTIPAAHAEISLSIIEAGKHAYSEKPLAISRADGERVVQAAAAAGLRLGCAPDTFLGGGLQTARKAIDDGLIGSAGRRYRILYGAWARSLASQSGHLLPERRRAAPGHGALLLDSAGRSDGPRWRGSPPRRAGPSPSASPPAKR